MKTIVMIFCAILGSQAALYQSSVCYLRYDACVGSHEIWLVVAASLILLSHVLIFIAVFGAVWHLTSREGMDTSEATAIAFTWTSVAEAALAGIAKRELWYLYRSAPVDAFDATATFVAFMWVGVGAFALSACIALIAWSAVSLSEDTER